MNNELVCKNDQAGHYTADDCREVSEEKKKIFESIVHSRHNYLIIGKAGTGKSTLLKYVKKNTTKNTVIVAPTGIAALIIEGQTIHSLFEIPPQLFMNGHDLDQLSQKNKKILKTMQLLIIDEISMVRADLIDAIDVRLKEARKNDEPFGGVQVVMFGDLFQLPPVVSDKEEARYLLTAYGSRFFFASAVWKRLQFELYELHEHFRQKDERFLEILNDVRHGIVSDASLAMLNTRFIRELPRDDNILVLTTINHTVTVVNNKKLAELPGDEVCFTAQVDGYLGEGSFPTEYELRLKIGAQVMLLKNDVHKKYVNGSVGVITGFGTDPSGDDVVYVKIHEATHAIGRTSWDKVTYVYDETEKRVYPEIVSSFTQFPLRLSWAITIHKSQGQTLQGAVLVDFGRGTFEGGQAYTALSRVCDFEKLYLRRPLMKSDFIVNKEVIAFLDDCMKKKCA